MPSSTTGRPLRVALTTGGLGLGGTEKGLVEHAVRFDPERVDVRVVAHHELGPRAVDLERAGVPVSCAGGDRARLAQLLDGVDVVHVFRAGLADPLLPAAVRDAGVPVLVETNVFGAIDASGDEPRFACHLFVGRMCAERYRARLGLAGPSFHDRHRVSHWPVDVARLRALDPGLAAAKAQLGLDPDRPVVGRVGRADDRKWRRMIVDALPHLLERAPETQVLLVGATDAVRARLRRHGILDRVTLVDPTAEEARLIALYAACDAVLMAAEIGESFSVAISEAMAVGRTVVTCSTPWVDNGQVEQIDHGVTGLVANHPVEVAEAVARLWADPAACAAMGAAAAAKVERLQEVGMLTDQLTRLYGALLAGDPPPADWRPSPAEVDAFAAEYPARRDRHFRALSGHERAQVQAERWRERTGWAARAARDLDAEKVSFALAIARSKVQELTARSR